MNKNILLTIMIIIIINSFLYCESVGKVIKITGDKQLYKLTKLRKKELIKEGTEVFFKDYLSTGKKTEALIRLKFDNIETDIKLKKNTKIRIIKKVKAVKCSGIKLLFGRMWSLFKEKKKNGYAVETHNSVAGVEGTEFEVSYDKITKISSLIVISGKVRFSAKAGMNKLGMVIPSKEVVLEPGETAEVPAFGKIIMKEKINKGKAEIDKEEVQVGQSDNLNLNGKYSYRIMAKLYNPFRVYINGYPKLNGVELVYKGLQQVVLYNLEEDTYDITILVNGYEHTFPIEVNSKTNKKLKVVKYLGNTVAPFIGKLRGQKNRDEKNKYMKCTLLVNGQRIPLTLRVSSEQAEYNYGYDLKFNATNLAGGNLFYFPKSLDEFPTLELEYTGNQPVKIRKHIIKFKADKKTYKVQF